MKTLIPERWSSGEKASSPMAEAHMVSGEGYMYQDPAQSAENYFCFDFIFCRRDDPSYISKYTLLLFLVLGDMEVGIHDLCSDTVPCWVSIVDSTQPVQYHCQCHNQKRHANAPLRTDRQATS